MTADRAMTDAGNFVSWDAAVAWLIAQPDQQQLVRDCYFDMPLLPSAERYWASEEWAAVTAFLPGAKGRALDIGAGRGISSYALARDGWQVTALEPDPSELVGGGAISSIAQQAQLSIDVVQEFGEKLPFADGAFDLVFTRQVLHHARDLKQLCSEISRVLKPGGRLVAIRDHVLHRREDMQAFLDGHILHNLYAGENAYLFQEYVDAIEQAPLTIDQSFRSFQTALHYDTQALHGIKAKLRQRMSRVPVLGAIAARIVTNDLVFSPMLKLASYFDHRPGVAASFICTKRGA